MDRSIVLLSGGLDSTTALAWALAQGATSVRCLSFDYGQRHAAELEAARAIAQHYRVEHCIITISERALHGSALTGDYTVPINRSEQDMGVDIPVTYVPARNTVFLALALSQAEAWGARDIVIGVNALDYSGYPDCRPEYIALFNQLAQLATREGVQGRPITVHAPLVTMSKAEIITYGAGLGAPYHLTHSCYDPALLDPLAGDWRACGRCDSCLLRRAGFETAGIPDPTRYAEALA